MLSSIEDLEKNLGITLIATYISHCAAMLSVTYDAGQLPQSRKVPTSYSQPVFGDLPITVTYESRDDIILQYMKFTVRVANYSYMLRVDTGKGPNHTVEYLMDKVTPYLHDIYAECKQSGVL